MINISFFCYVIVSLFSFVFGIIYITRDKFMPYHEVALNKTWEDLEKNQQTLLLALMRVAGSGFIGSSVITIFLIYIYHLYPTNIILLITPIPCLCMSFGSFLATTMVSQKTPTKPPLKLTILSFSLLCVGILNSLFFVN